MTNLTCSCTNVPLQYNLSACIQKGCNFTEQISTFTQSLVLTFELCLTETEVAEVNQVICEGLPVDFNGWPVPIVGLVFGIITLITVLLRCYSRYTIARGFWWDDWSMIGAMVVLSVAKKASSETNCCAGIIDCNSRCSYSQ